MAAELVESYEYKDGYLIRKVKTRDGAFVSSMLPSNVAYNNITPEDYDLCWLKMKSKPVLNNPSKEMKLVDLFSSTGPMTLGLVEAVEHSELKSAHPLPLILKKAQPPITS